jgi:hypothetical protein
VNVGDGKEIGEDATGSVRQWCGGCVALDSGCENEKDRA